MNTRAMKSAIMRRVWRHFAWTIVTNRGLVPGLAFGISIQLFREQVFVARVLESFLATEVGQLPGFMVRLFTNADTAVLLTLAIMTASIWLLYRYTVTSQLARPTAWFTRRLTTG